MKSFLFAFLLALAAAASHFALVAGLAFAGVGPFGRGMSLVTSGAMNSFDEAASRAWFQSAEQSMTIDRFVLWPAVFLLVALLCVRLLPQPRWWHFALIACAVLPLSVPVALESSVPPGQSPLSPWLHVIAEVCAYTVLVAVLVGLARRLLSPASSNAA